MNELFPVVAIILEKIEIEKQNNKRGVLKLEDYLNKIFKIILKF